MTTISILPEPPSTTEMKFRAIGGQRQSVGDTPGQALDALSAQLNDQESGTLLVVQQMRPDRFFNEAQQLRLGELMQRWRTARDGGLELPADEQAELEQLITAELEGATKRAEALFNGLKP